MYRVSPFTYIIEGLLGQGLCFGLCFVIELNSSSAIGGQEIVCTSTELVPISPPDGLTCLEYMGTFISFAGGYLIDPDLTSGCLFCPFKTTDQFMLSQFNIEYAHRWRDLGIVLGFVLFNVSFLSCCSPCVLTTCTF
jgi:ATP-binding cassette subfamily G (WHITE) protein 2 (SNQ2)